MTNKRTRRNRVLIAAILALLVAGSLCVWGATALGLQLRSPALEAAISAFTEAKADEDGVVVAANGNGDVDVDTGNGDGDGDGDDDGNGDGDDATASNEFCFLGLFCITLNADADVNTDAGLNVNVDADTNEDGLNVNVDANGITDADCRLLDVNADGILNGNDGISSQTDLDIAALCGDIGFDVDLDGLLNLEN